LTQSLPRRRPGLVDENQPFGVKPALVFLPPLAPAGDIEAILLAGVQALFLNVMPSRAKNAHTAQECANYLANAGYAST
jgi:hypothetical protein